MKPILFNTEMVQAILEGRKTVTRRSAFPADDLRPFPHKDYPEGWWYRGRAYRTWDDAANEPQGVMSLSKYKCGDILYVRETWFYETAWEDITAGEPDTPSGRYQHRYIFKATSPDYPVDQWRPSIHMPKEAARIFLRVTGLRVERLQDITEEQARAEGGCTFADKIGDGKFEDVIEFDLTARDAFSELWDSTIKPADRPLYGWEANPWVWVIEFERIGRDEALAGRKEGG